MDVEEAYRVVEVAGKGRGLVASRTLEAGELVLSEKMFLKLDSSSAKDLSVFQMLDPEIKEKLDKLSCPAEDIDFDKSDPDKYLAPLPYEEVQVEPDLHSGEVGLLCCV